jgi:hypothetical protein
MTEAQKSDIVIWNEVYPILAEALKNYYEGNPQPAEKLYQLASENKIISAKKWFSNLSKFKNKGIDPVHVFASFNRHRQRLSDKISLINEWFKLLDSPNNYVDILFDGSPSPFTVKILSARLLKEQNDIWNVFISIISNNNYTLKDNIEQKLESWYGLKLPSFTIFLFWIAPDRFLSLDKNTTAYLIKTGRIKIVPKTIVSYNELLNEINPSEYINIVNRAYSGIKTVQENDPTAIDRFRGKSKSIPNKEYTRIIGVKIPQSCPDKYRKSLKLEEYNFFKDCSIAENEIIIHHDFSFVDIYSSPNDNFSINVHAIVGENGSGKSALAELLIMAINNIYNKCATVKKTDFITIEDLELELYYEAYGFYKITIKGNEIKRFGFTANGSNFRLIETELHIDMEFLSIFFYNVLLNYSLHGLNSSHNKTWLEKIYIKNDGYENPIVIEPYRSKGVIDINDQNELLRTRFLANILDLIDIETNTENQNIVDPILQNNEIEYPNYTFSSAIINNNLEVKSVKLKLKDRKTNVIDIIQGEPIRTKEDFKEIGFDLDYVFDCINDNFDLGDVDIKKIAFNNNRELNSIAIRYLIQKIIKISRTYEPYKVKYSFLRGNEMIKEYIELLSKDFSHITNKIHQTIHFLAQRTSYIEQSLDMETFSATITLARIMNEHIDEQSMKTIHLMPPPFFESEIMVGDIFEPLKENFPFEQLSSGIRQHLFSIHTILYHLKNLNSVASTNRTSYPFANIILDEVELYAHPEMQRKYLADLLHLLKMTEWEGMLGISICFVTHSPFILSDITNDRILFLKNEIELVQVNKTKTFGANIHEILSNAFFLKSTIGEFAQQKIQSIVSFHQKVEIAESDQLIKLKGEYNTQKDEFRYIVNNIGEKYIQGILLNHLDKLDEILLNNKEKKMLEIERLQKEIDELKNNIDAQN